MFILYIFMLTSFIMLVDVIFCIYNLVKKKTYFSKTLFYFKYYVEAELEDFLIYLLNSFTYTVAIPVIITFIISILI